MRVEGQEKKDVWSHSWSLPAKVLFTHDEVPGSQNCIFPCWRCNHFPSLIFFFCLHFNTWFTDGYWLISSMIDFLAPIQYCRCICSHSLKTKLPFSLSQVLEHQLFLLPLDWCLKVLSLPLFSRHESMERPFPHLLLGLFFPSPLFSFPPPPTRTCHNFTPPFCPPPFPPFSLLAKEEERDAKRAAAFMGKNGREKEEGGSEIWISGSERERAIKKGLCTTLLLLCEERFFVP